VLLFEEEKIKAVLKNLETLGSIKDQELLQLLKQRVDFKLMNLKEVIWGRGKNLSSGLEESFSNKAYVSTLRTAEIIKDLTAFDWNRAAVQMHKTPPANLEEMRSIPLLQGQAGLIEEDKNSTLRGQIEYIKENISSLTVLEGIREEIPVEKMDWDKLEKLISQEERRRIEKKEETRAEEKPAEKLKSLVENLSPIGKQKDHIIALMMKNAMPMALKEAQNLSFFLKNEQQLGHQIKEMIQCLEECSDKEVQKGAAQVKGLLKQISQDMKRGSAEINKTWDDIGKVLREAHSRTELLEDRTKLQFRNNMEKLLDSLEIQSQLNKSDTVFQLPFFMNQQVKNLQIYIMNRKKGSRKIDPENMSVLLNFETEHMGNINIYVGVTHKKVVMKMGVKSQADKKIMEAHGRNMQALLESLGYELKEMSFRVEEEQHILSSIKELEETYKPVKHFLDIRI
jgi:hypothetical protein